MLIKRTKLWLLMNALGLCLVLFTTAAVAQETATETKAEVKVEEEAVPETAENSKEIIATPSQETTVAPVQEVVEALADKPAVIPECTKFSRLRLDVAVEKSTRIDNDLYKSLEGKTIRSITFKPIDVFDEEDPKENNWLYRSLNQLHFTTNSNVVESQLLFKVGDPLNIQAIHESERILRQRKYFTNAYILPESVCGNEVDLLVVTQDAWVLEPEFSFSQKSGDTESGYGISDGNIFGTGNALSIGYSKNEQRSGIGYEFYNPYFLNKQIAVRAEYEDTSDGRNSLINVSRPFYSLETPWAAGMRLEDIALVDIIRSRDEVVNEFRHQTLLNEVFIGKATNVTSDRTQRWLVGFTNEEHKFYPTDETLQGIPVDYKITYPWVEYQYHENRFGIFKNVNQIQRPEDIALGQNFSFRLGYGPESMDNPDDVVRFKGEYINITDVADHHILEYEVTIDGRQHLELTGMDSTILTTRMSYNFFLDEKNRWYARANYDVGQDLAQYEELTVGGITGLRGYPVDYSRGKKRYVFTLERRYFSDFHIFNLLRVGVVAFCDVGKAWGLPGQPYSPLLSDVGFGLRLSSTKIRVGNVVHIDIATPTSAKSGIDKYQLTIGAEAKF
ncbi:MAG: BamA/TamA family outer membrane protein [Pseudomonadota bacterium]